MTRLQFELETRASPERVQAAITDVTDRRRELCPGLKEFRVHTIGETWADVREGSGGFIWVDEHYDWSQPGIVEWTARDSGFLRPGSPVCATLDPLPDGGTRVGVTWDRTGKNPLIRALMDVTAALGLMPMRGSWHAGLRRIEEATEGRETTPG